MKATDVIPASVSASITYGMSIFWVLKRTQWENRWKDPLLCLVPGSDPTHRSYNTAPLTPKKGIIFFSKSDTWRWPKIVLTFCYYEVVTFRLYFKRNRTHPQHRHPRHDPLQVLRTDRGRWTGGHLRTQQEYVNSRGWGGNEKEEKLALAVLAVTKCPMTQGERYSLPLRVKNINN